MPTNFSDFLFQGSPPPNTTQTTTSTTTMPAWYQEYLRGMIQRSNLIAGQPYQASPVENRVAPLTENQLKAQQMTEDMVGNYQPNLNAAQGMIQGATGTLPQNIQQYMSPYTDSVVNRIAQLGQRNLSENLMPAVNDIFTGAGQFGGSRHADFAGRALRDANESILGQQAQALESGYSTAGNLFNQDQNRNLQAGEQMGALAQMQQTMGRNDQAALQSVGATEQQQMERAAALEQANFERQRDYPKTQAEWLNSQMKAYTPQGTITQTQTGPGSNFQPSGLAQMASAAYGFGSLFGGGQ